MNISTELSILFTLFWREEIMLFWQEDKDKGKYINDLFYIYLNCLNDKEKWLKLSIYKKYNSL